MCAIRAIDYGRDLCDLAVFLNAGDVWHVTSCQAALARGDACILVAERGGRVASIAISHFAVRDELGRAPDGETSTYLDGLGAYLPETTVTPALRSRGRGAAPAQFLCVPAQQRGERHRRTVLRAERVAVRARGPTRVETEGHCAGLGQDLARSRETRVRDGRAHMSGYDRQYHAEPHLFGAPYPEFVAFVEALEHGGSALDLGCGQGRDALVLAAHGFRVTGIDASQVAIAQMTERARARGLDVTGIVGDYYQFEFTTDYDAIVMDSILHFGKDRQREIDLLDRVFEHTRPGGHVFTFVHRSRPKEKHLRTYLGALGDQWTVVVDQYIDYVYQETQTGFRSASQFSMTVVQRQQGRSQDDR